MQSFLLSLHQVEVKMKHISAEPLELSALLQRAHHPEAGGIVLFSGEARNNHNGNEVLFLEYEAHIPMAEKMIDDIVQSAIERWNLIAAYAIHRIGNVGISESAVVVITSHAHRKPAYEANQFIIDQLKAEVPIWKCEHYTDGTHEWSTNNFKIT